MAVARAVVEAVDAGCRRWDVCWLATDLADGGVTFVLTAGAPTATEHDEERMLRAVRSIVDVGADRLRSAPASSRASCSPATSGTRPGGRGR